MTLETSQKQVANQHVQHDSNFLGQQVEILNYASHLLNFSLSFTLVRQVVSISQSLTRGMWWGWGEKNRH